MPVELRTAQLHLRHPSATTWPDKYTCDTQQNVNNMQHEGNKNQHISYFERLKRTLCIKAQMSVMTMDGQRDEKLERYMESYI